MFCAVSQTLEQEVMERLPLWENIESGALLYALKQLDERERYVSLPMCWTGAHSM